MKIKLIITALMMAGIMQAGYSQSLSNTSWRGRDDLAHALMTAIIGSPGDSMRMNFDENAAFSIVFYDGDTTIALNGTWWQSDDHSFAWVDTSSILDVVCPGIDTSVYSYSIVPGDTLSIAYVSSTGSTCVTKNTLFTGSEWSRPNTVTAVQEAAASGAGIKIFPNPATDLLTIRIEKGNPGNDWEYMLYDVQGRTCRIDGAGVQHNDPGKTIDIHSLVTGLYVLQIRLGTSRYYFKIEKH